VPDSGFLALDDLGPAGHQMGELRQDWLPIGLADDSASMQAVVGGRSEKRCVEGNDRLQRLDARADHKMPPARFQAAFGIPT
jgi:hypothetical protein